MNIRARLDKFYDGRDVVVIVKCPDDGWLLRGKYIVGRHHTDQNIVALVLDAAFDFHPAIAKKYRLVALGGGHFSVDHGQALIHLSGKSDTYGAEPDRELTRRALKAALPSYKTVIE